ncbi:MAG TPA: hypothetical protein VFG79_13370 [Solirubrobacter sp.]|nr:hypothetical protein [Solirubrobacter sp.]
MRIARTLLLSALASAAVAAPAHAAPWTFGLWATPKHLLGADERAEKDADKARRKAEKVAAKGADDLAAGSEGDAAGTGGDDAQSGETAGGDDSQTGNNGNGNGNGNGAENSQRGNGNGNGNGGDDSERGNGNAGGDDDSERINGNDDAQRDAGDSGAPALGPAAPPIAGERVGAAAKTGEVRVQLPGSDAFVALDAAATMPVGTLVDARAGAVVLKTALPGGGRDRGTFGGGMFVVRQNVRDGVTELRLRGGSYGRCKTRALASTASKRRKRAKRVIRRLWGRDHGGRFRTHGHNSVATVRGTRWLTVERCGGTLTRVTQGAVEVHNRRNGRTVLLHAGESYLAKRHPRG